MNKLRAYVEAGGALISEGLPAYFGDQGRAGATQPNLGLDQFFGARKQYVEFTPDLLEKLTLEVNGRPIHGRYFLQNYAAAGGKAVGRYANGHVAAVENQVGKGRTLLIGALPGAGYILHHSPEEKAFFADLLKFTSVRPLLQNKTPETEARLHMGPRGNYLWITNPARSRKTATVSIDESGPQFQTVSGVWGNNAVSVNGRSLTVTLAPRDGAVILLHYSELGTPCRAIL